MSEANIDDEPASIEYSRNPSASNPSTPEVVDYVTDTVNETPEAKETRYVSPRSARSSYSV